MALRPQSFSTGTLMVHGALLGTDRALTAPVPIPP